MGVELAQAVDLNPLLGSAAMVGLAGTIFTLIWKTRTSELRDAMSMNAARVRELEHRTDALQSQVMGLTEKLAEAKATIASLESNNKNLGANYRRVASENETLREVLKGEGRTE